LDAGAHGWSSLSAPISAWRDWRVQGRGLGPGHMVPVPVAPTIRGTSRMSWRGGLRTAAARPSLLHQKGRMPALQVSCGCRERFCCL